VILILSKSDQTTLGELAGELGLQTEKLQQVVPTLFTEKLPLVRVTDDSGISLNREFRTGQPTLEITLLLRSIVTCGPLDEPSVLGVNHANNEESPESAK
jgi:hypothetical protein